MLETRDPDTIPAPERLLPICRSLALIEEIDLWGSDMHGMRPAERSQFNSLPQGNFVELGSYDQLLLIDPQTQIARFLHALDTGDWFKVFFEKEGTVVFGRAKGTVQSLFSLTVARRLLALLDGYPRELWHVADDQDFERAGFCFWREAGDESWWSGDLSFLENEPPVFRHSSDGSIDLLLRLDGPEYVCPPKRCDNCEECHDAQNCNCGDPEECEKCFAPLEAVQRLWEGEPLTRSLIKELSRDADADTILARARAAGHPVGE